MTPGSIAPSIYECAAGASPCANLALEAEGKTARQIFGPVDEMKFRSSMTLFMKAAPGEPLFAECLGKYFGGEADPTTLERLSG